MTNEQLDEIEKLAADGAFKAAGSYALPLVKALREARSALEWQAAMTKALSESQERLVNEVKEARAEVERLKDSVATLDKLYVSRTDELRESEAEVERLRSAISRFVNQYPWQAGPEIQELKALKEGDR